MTFKIANTRKVAGSLLALFSAFVLEQSALAQVTVAWNSTATNTNGVNFNRTQNWGTGGGTNPANNNLQLNAGGAFTANPALTADLSINSLAFLTGSTTAFNVGSPSFTLTIVNGITNASSAVQTISAPLALGGSQSWTTTSGGTLAVSGTINFGTNALTVGSSVTAGAGDTTISGAIASSAGSLVKEGAGTLTLSSSSIAYTGGTTVNAGTLRMNGNMTSAANSVTINGGTLAGTGTIAGAVTLNSGGFIAPGAPGIGSLTLASLTFNGGGTLSLSLGSGSTSDSLSIGGAFTKGSVGAYTIDFGNTGSANTTYTLATFNSTTFSASDFTALNSNFTGTFAINSGQLEFTTSAIPEPSTYAAILGVGALGMVIYRRRKARSTEAAAVAV